MSELSFYFHAPTPRYFRDNGFFKNPKNKAFVDWCFERCSHEDREIVHDNQKIALKPYQFIFGRTLCSDQIGLTEDEVRTQQKRWEELGFLKKAPNKTPNRFTIYEWVMTAFLKDDPQPRPRCTPNKPPTNPHNLDNKKDISIDISKEEEAQPAAQLRSKDSLSFDFDKWEFIGITEKDFADWKLLYPHVNVPVETIAAAQWIRSNPSKSTKTLWRKFLTGWFKRSNDYAENKKAYRSAASSPSGDRTTKNKDGTPIKSRAEDLF